MKTHKRSKAEQKGVLLTVDVGNTNIVLCTFRGDKLLDHWRIATEMKKTADEYSITLQQLAALNNLEKSSVKDAVIASVVPHLSPALQEAIQQVFAVRAKIIDHSTPMPIHNLYANPREVGIDRLANAVGGKMLYGTPIIIVDFGTAITLDVISREGDYLGGTILPGLEMSADALFKKTSLLPRILLDRPAFVLGRTTITSMQSGLYFGLVSAIDGLIEKLWNEVGFRSKVVATGGLAQLFAKESKIVDETEPFLGHHGLRFIWLHNINKSK